MTGDKLIFEFQGRRFGIDTSEVAGILEAEKASCIPGQGSIIRGVISLRGEPVTVVDAGMLFTGAPGTRGPQDKIVVVRSRDHVLGIDIGPSKPVFVWAEELKDFSTTQVDDPRIRSVIEAGDSPISIIDCTAIFEEAEAVLATEDDYAHEGPDRR